MVVVAVCVCPRPAPPPAPVPAPVPVPTPSSSSRIRKASRLQRRDTAVVDVPVDETVDVDGIADVPVLTPLPPLTISDDAPAPIVAALVVRQCGWCCGCWYRCACVALTL